MNVVFDFGAVLFTWRPAEIVAEVFPERASDATQAHALACEMFGHADWHNFDRGLLRADDVVARTAERLNLHRDTLHQLVAGIGDRLRPMPDTIDVLQKLHALRAAGQGVTGLYFLSNMPEPYARELEQKHVFLSLFDGGIFSGDVKLSKPDARIYQQLQTRYGLEPARTVFIDDLRENIDAAMQLGWYGVQFRSAEQLAQDLHKDHGL